MMKLVVHMRFDGDPRLRVLGQERVENGIRDAIADLIGMTFGDRLAGEDVVLFPHARSPSSGSARRSRASRASTMDRTPFAVLHRRHRLDGIEPRARRQADLLPSVGGERQGVLGSRVERRARIGAGGHSASSDVPSDLASSNSRLRTCGSAMR